MAAALGATRARKKPAKRTVKKATKKAAAKKLTAKQLAQRKYAANMKSVRKRAKVTRGGKGLIKKRAAATTLRQKLGVGIGA